MTLSLSLSLSPPLPTPVCPSPSVSPFHILPVSSGPLISVTMLSLSLTFHMRFLSPLFIFSYLPLTLNLSLPQTHCQIRQNYLKLPLLLLPLRTPSAILLSFNPHFLRSLCFPLPHFLSLSLEQSSLFFVLPSSL